MIVTYADRNGLGVSGSWFQLNAGDCQAPYRPARVTDSSGSVRFERVPLGRYCLVQARPAAGYAPAPQRPVVVDQEDVVVVIGATWLGATPTALPTSPSMPDTMGAGPELELRVWRCAGLLGSRPSVVRVAGPDAVVDGDGTIGTHASIGDCVPGAAELLIYPFGDMDGTTGGAMPVHVGATGSMLISVGLAVTSGRSPHVLSEPRSGSLTAFELLPASRTNIDVFLGGITSNPDVAGPPVLALPVTGSGYDPTIRSFLHGALLTAFVVGITIWTRRRILTLRL